MRLQRRDIVRVAILMLLLRSPLVAASSAAQQDNVSSGEISTLSLLQRLTSPAASLRPLPAGTRVIEVSSHDLLDGNFDGGSYSPQTQHPLTYVRREDGAYVLVDEPGPACLVRMWMTAKSSWRLGDPSAFGRLQLFFDARSHATVDEPAAEFFGGLDPRFPRPLVNDWLVSSGGNYSYVPFCFAHRLEIRVTSVPPEGTNGYFQFALVTFPFGTQVKTFAPADLTSVSRELANTGATPVSDPSIRLDRRVRPGESALLVSLRGAGTIRFLKLSVTPFTEQTLQALSLRVAVNGERPQIDVPVGSLFGDGLEVRRIRSIAFGMSPAAHSGYLALPIPYRSGAKVSISSNAGASLGLEAWTGRPSPGAGTLYGQRRLERTVLGKDYTALEAAGSGRLASLVDEVLDGGVNDLGEAPYTRPDQGFMEGDDRVYVDGSRSPSIYGTGTEDIFNGGWYFSQGPFSLPFSGAGPLERDSDGDGARSMYRIFSDDGVLWSSKIDIGIQHGGGDDRIGERVAVTTFSYRWPQSIQPSDAIRFASVGSARGHQLTGKRRHLTLRSYFEGVQSGNSYYESGGSSELYPAPPAGQSIDSYASAGIAFAHPVSFLLTIDSRNDGVVLRRLLDQATVAPVLVAVDGRPAGEWDPNQFADPAKRWLESDFELSPSRSAGKRHIRVTLSPLGGTTATAFSLEAFSRMPSSG